MALNQRIFVTSCSWGSGEDWLWKVASAVCAIGFHDGADHATLLEGARSAYWLIGGFILTVLAMFLRHRKAAPSLWGVAVCAITYMARGEVYVSFVSGLAAGFIAPHVYAKLSADQKADQNVAFPQEAGVTSQSLATMAGSNVSTPGGTH